MMNNDDEDVYRYLVVDSGPIIRLTGMSTLWKRAKHFYTVPAVLQEIRDAKARQHLETLPFTLTPREASREGMQAVLDFARQTGDYNSLSSVDIQVLGLLYDLEREGCGGDISHIRTTPKRTLGLGKIESLGGGGTTVLDEKNYIVEEEEEDELEEAKEEEETCSDPLHLSSASSSTANDETKVDDEVCSRPKTWAALLNPTATPITPALFTEATTVSFAKMELSANDEQLDGVSGGQFSDAEDDHDSLGSMSDEECDAYILDPTDGDPRKLTDEQSLEKELQSDFPSLAASLLVAYEGSDDECDYVPEESVDPTDTDIYKEEEKRKLHALQPISKSGKLYNSFTKYGDLMKPKPKTKVNARAPHRVNATKARTATDSDTDEQQGDRNQSRIIGGMGFAGQGDDVEDDGEGWITCAKDISSMKAVGALDPSRNPTGLDANAVAKKQTQGPLMSQRAACTTTDFAMQNVILQMNLELLSVDGMKVRKLKNWVTRCGACFTVYTNSDNPGPLGKRLFCERCGSDMMQRIAASVDGKTGRLRLHLSKKYKHNLRGTKFSLPKPGSGNRFQGDLLLREDQLLMGAWSQKVKMRSGGKARDAAQSMFGRDIATNVGCHASATNVDDIRVGFGRRNPNAAKGRERRGKKKKSTDKACGLRRY
jgi:RNA-binding protein NOB1